MSQSSNTQLKESRKHVRLEMLLLVRGELVLNLFSKKDAIQIYGQEFPA